MKQEIIINNNIKEETVPLFDPDGNFIGNIENELAFNDVRIQIMKKSLKGYYIMWNEEKYEIDHNGRMRNWPPIYECLESQLTTLLSGR